MSWYPKISIITPSYNQGKFIEQTIQSVLDQNYPNLEYIIIDGGSSDETLSVIKKYEKHLAYCISEKDRGQSHAINKGIQKSTGDIVNWLNSDDYYMPGALRHIAEQFKNPLITAYCGRSRVFSDSNERISGGTDIYAGNLFKTIGWARIDQPETFFKRSVWETIGFLNEEFHYIMDKEWWIRYLLIYGLDGIIKDDKVLVNFRIHSESKTGSQKEEFENETINYFYSISVQNRMKNIYEFIEKNFKVRLITIDPSYSNEISKEYINYFLFYLYNVAYAKNNYALSKKIREIIVVNSLSVEDSKLFKRVNLRMKLIPVYMKKVFNRL